MVDREVGRASQELRARPPAESTVRHRAGSRAVIRPSSPRPRPSRARLHARPGSLRASLSASCSAAARDAASVCPRSFEAERVAPARTSACRASPSAAAQRARVATMRSKGAHPIRRSSSSWTARSATDRASAGSPAARSAWPSSRRRPRSRRRGALVGGRPPRRHEQCVRVAAPPPDRGASACLGRTPRFARVIATQ